MRSVSFIQATLICFLGIPIFGNEYLEEDHVLATTPYSSFYASMALGYFMWDAIVSLYFVNYFGIGFAIHGIVSVMVFAAGLAYGFIHYYSAAFLLFELSTPFLDLRWFGMTFGTTVFPEWFQLANNIALIVTFFLVRIVWGWYMFARLSIDLYATRLDPRFPILGALATVTSNISIDILNIYWFSKMASIGIATVRKWGVKEEKEKEI
ncbi:DEKNAAC100977 [Brettanomyces naardenensis]|uniref:DEKNAAC100977 n=1 Tax=Brettanomyces naardenensis TaxID=13370 RepID=A0A448YGQ9_BRENA|nr:DEKNAAC100977 [Brettanomyces naardenensis]